MMRMLLWKDWRLMRPLLIACGVLYLTPAIIFAIWAAFMSPGEDLSTAGDWAGMILGVLFFGLMISTLAMPMIGANLLAKERRERTAEFVATLPVGRGRIVLSKAIMAVLVALTPSLFTLVAGLVGVGVMALVGPGQGGSGPGINDVNEMVSFAAALGGGACLSFGLAWFLSSALKSETVAAGLSLLLTAIAASLYTLAASRNPHLGAMLFGTVAGLAGVAAFGAGTVIALRRGTP